MLADKLKWLAVQYFEVFSAWVLWIRVGPCYSDSARQARHFYRSHDHIWKILIIA